MSTVFLLGKKNSTHWVSSAICFLFLKKKLLYLFGFGAQLDIGRPLLHLVPPCSLCLLEDFSVSLPDLELLDKPWS